MELYERLPNLAYKPMINHTMPRFEFLAISVEVHLVATRIPQVKYVSNVMKTIVFQNFQGEGQFIPGFR